MLRGLRWAVLGVWFIAGMNTVCSGYSATDAAMAAIAAHRMHADLLEATDEAMAYVVLNDIGGKENYLKKLDDFNSRAADFREYAALDDPKNATLKGKFQKAWLAKLELAKAIDGIITKFEEDKSLKKEDLAPVQEQIRVVSSQTEALVTQSVKPLNVADDPLLVIIFDSLKMEADMLEAIGCAYAYVLLRDAAMKETFYSKVKHSDDLSEGFITRAGLAKLGHENRMQNYNSFMAEKDSVEKAAAQLFRDLQLNQGPDQNLISRMKNAVDRFAKHMDMWLDLNIKALTGIAEE